MPVCQETQDFCKIMTWDNMSEQLFWVPLLSQCVMALLMPAMSYAHDMYFGSKEKYAIQDKLQTVRFILAILEGVFSLVCYAFWVQRCYQHEVGSGTKNIEMLLCMFFIVNYFAGAAKTGWARSYVWTSSAVIDVITVSSVLASPGPEHTSWIGWGHLRVFRALVAWDKIEELGLRSLSLVTKAVIKTLLRTAAVVTALGGTVMMLEVLGDPQFIAEKERFVSTDMGDLSFVMMVYWIFTTLSTVGYGDFSPTTVLSRFFICFAIVYGIMLFSSELDKFTSLKNDEGQGRGRYLPPIHGIHSVIVLGGGVAKPSSILSAFFEELYHADHLEDHLEDGWPACSLMSTAEQPDFLKSLISSMPKHAKMRIKYFVGNSMQVPDLERLDISKAVCVLVLPNFGACDKMQEDDNNILIALSVRRSFPAVPLVLATTLTESCRKAVNVGLLPQQCLSLDHLTSCLFYQSCICRGWITLVTNLMTSESIEHDASLKLQDQWMLEYCHGLNMGIHAVCLHVAFKDKSFADLVEHSVNFGVVPIAVQIKGRIVLNPTDHVFVGKDIVYALADKQYEAIEFLASPYDDWTEVYWKQVYDNTPKRLARLATDKEYQNHLRSSSIKKQLIDLDLKSYQNKADDITKRGGHFVLILLSTNSNIWRQVQDFVTSLRSPLVPAQVPIVVLAPGPVPDAVIVSEVFDNDPTCSLIFGFHSETRDLIRAGVCLARNIVIFADQSEGEDAEMSDSSAVICVTSIENLLEEEGKCVPILCEFVNVDSLRLLSSQPRYLSKGKEASSIDRSFYMHPRFASGEIFVVNALGGFFASRFYTPGLLEVMSALITGRDQESTPWQIRMPEKFVGRCYGEIVVEFARAPWNAVCLGLYRPSTENPGMKFMYTNPIHSIEMYDDDLIVVLGNVEFRNLCSLYQLFPSEDTNRNGSALPSCGSRPPSPPESFAGKFDSTPNQSEDTSPSSATPKKSGRSSSRKKNSRPKARAQPESLE